uniref:Uncharacterized protein n=1 Tax=Rhizophora mucronata TaxID=61149 RepID=A0A2P2P9P3_RHIMU
MNPNGHPGIIQRPLDTSSRSPSFNR